MTIDASDFNGKIMLLSGGFLLTTEFDIVSDKSLSICVNIYCTGIHLITIYTLSRSHSAVGKLNEF